MNTTHVYSLISPLQLPHSALCNAGCAISANTHSAISTINAHSAISTGQTNTHSAISTLQIPTVQCPFFTVHICHKYVFEHCTVYIDFCCTVSPEPSNEPSFCIWMQKKTLNCFTSSGIYLMGIAMKHAFTLCSSSSGTFSH